MSKTNKKLEKLGVPGVLSSLKNHKGVEVFNQSAVISFDCTGSVGIKTLGKIDFLCRVAGYRATPVVPVKGKKKK